MNKTILGAAAFLVLAAAPALSADVPAHLPPETWKPADSYECFAVFAKKHDGYGEKLTRYGPEAIADLDLLRFPNGETLDADVWAVRTGESAWLELFDKRGFRRSLYRVGPGQTVNLKLPNIDSYQLNCEPPLNWQSGW